MATVGVASISTGSGSSGMDTNSAGGLSGSGSDGNGGNGVERRCINSDCNIAKLLPTLTKRKTSQLITAPNISKIPTLVSGCQTIFQIEGSFGKMSDIVNVPGATNETGNLMYRILPNTHAHIVNYVVVDTEGESLRKINENDPSTMLKLLESQRISADQMLKKLLIGHGGVAKSATVVPSPITSTTVSIGTTIQLRSNAQKVTTPRPPVKSVANIKKVTITGSSYAPPTQPPPPPPPSLSVLSSNTQSPTLSPVVALPSNAIQIGSRAHPNFRITAVASAEGAATLGNSGVTPVNVIPSNIVSTAVPLITPVPLATLQNSSPALVPIPSASVSPVVTAEKQSFDKMQSEIMDLRRTVQLLVAAQAKTQQSQQQKRQTTDNSKRGAKRGRT